MSTHLPATTPIAPRSTPATGPSARLGMLVGVLAGLLIWGVARNVMAAGWLTGLDALFANWVQGLRTPLLTLAMRAVTELHSTLATVVCCATVAVYARREGHTGWGPVFAAVVPAGMLVNLALKHIVHRPRPPLEGFSGVWATYGFPSGHTAGATLFYVALAAYFMGHAAGHTVGFARQAWLAAAAVAAITLVGFSRVYLGEHYLSDVLGAVLLGVAWLSLCRAAGTAWRRWRPLPQGVADADVPLQPFAT